MSTQVTKPNLQPSEDGISALIRRPEYSDRFKEVLRDRAPQFMSSVIQVARTLGKDCEPKSIIASAMTAAALDLPIDKNLGFAWIVPYKQNGVKYGQFQMGWKGFVQLAQRSGQYKNISVPRAINAEAFSGYDSIGVPIIDWNLVDESKEAVGYAFGWRLVNGGESIFFWSIAKIKAHAQRYSQAYRSGYDSPWKTHFPEMAQKTLVKNSLSQFGVLSIQMQNAIQFDSAIVKDVGSEPEYVDNEQIEGTKQSKPQIGKPEPVAEVEKNITPEKPVDEKPKRAKKVEPEPAPAKSEGEGQPEASNNDGDLGPQTETSGRKFQVSPDLDAKLKEMGVSDDGFDKWVASSGRDETWDKDTSSAKLLADERALKKLKLIHGAE